MTQKERYAAAKEAYAKIGVDTDAVIAKLKENGSDKIVAEVQTQLDEWIANK